MLFSIYHHDEKQIYHLDDDDDDNDDNDDNDDDDDVNDDDVNDDDVNDNDDDDDGTLLRLYPSNFCFSIR